ncbi:hypothetical protein PoB_000279800 [Plakobranchus ocellatus]|uniref:Uncharacterized protein n=1 Tax=Plakobranchus ocellatus TaxID=259542 RepID=A0AAV3Y0Y3_9GAST|nr:hypothetical protein PoB_000279800 [Plakobranchus ocellatus]
MIGIYTGKETRRKMWLSFTYKLVNNKVISDLEAFLPAKVPVAGLCSTQKSPYRSRADSRSTVPPTNHRKKKKKKKKKKK